MKKLLYHEIAEGQFSEMVQKDFDQAQSIVTARGVAVKLQVEITIFPESREHRGTGRVKFKSVLKQPARESIEYITEVDREGRIVDSGDRQLDAFTNDQSQGRN